MAVLRPPTEIDDAALLAHVASGDVDAFTAIYDRHHGAALSVARRLLPLPAAEDVAHEALLALWRSASRFAPERGTVGALVTVMARSRALDQLRRDRARQGAFERAGAEAQRTAHAPAPELELLRREQAAELAAALERLPDDQQRIVRMVHLGGCTHAQAADELGIPVGTAKGRTRLGLDKLRRALGESRAA